MFRSPHKDTTELNTYAKDISNELMSYESCFIYDAHHIRHQIWLFNSWRAPWGVTLRYAMKANPNKHILSIMRESWLMIDASSEHEVYRAINAWFSPEQIQLTWQILPKNLETLLSLWVKFCACSLHQLKQVWVSKLVDSVWIRLNPGLWSGQFPWVNVWWTHSSFWIWHEQLDHAVSLATSLGIKITTLHTHIGSWSDPLVWKKVASLTLSFVHKLPDVTHVDLGWWLKVARMKNEKSADITEIGAYITQEFEDFYAQTDRKLHLEIEPWTALVANSWYLLWEIDDVVSTWVLWYTFVKLDIWMSEIIRPIMYGAVHPIWSTSSSDEVVSWVYVWHSCESSDMITVDRHGTPLTREMYAPTIWDKVLIWWVGAYCSAMSTIHYNSYPQVAEYILDGWTLSCIREVEKLEDVWRLEV